MESLISLVNRIQRACTALGDYGEESALPTLWDSLPSIAVVGGQVGFSIFVVSSLMCFSRWVRSGLGCFYKFLVVYWGFCQAE